MTDTTSLPGDLITHPPHDSAPPPHTPPPLSDRETLVLHLIALGYSNKEIAGRLMMSVKTVETYKARGMEKLGTRTRVGLIRHAIGAGWLLTADAPDER